MLNYIHKFPNEKAAEFNEDFLSSKNDFPIVDYVIMAMKEYEAISNIEILSYDIINDVDEVDINEHNININFKRKIDKIEIPKYKYLSTNRVGEIRFVIKIKTNLNEKIITKKILIPIEYDGFYTINNKKWKTLWQLVDASTYSQRGRITLKSRMPIIIYNFKKRPIVDINGEVVEYSILSYALNTRVRRGASKIKVKFINPIMIYAAKIGIKKTIEYFGLDSIIKITKHIKDDHDKFRYFQINDITFKVDKYLADNNKFIGSFVCMLYNLQNTEFPVTWENYENLEYWKCRIGYIGALKSKNLFTFLEKGKTTIYMIERLLDLVTIENLRLPNIYKKDIYAVLRWMIMDFDSLKNRNNLDINNKRIRKNEYIVSSSLGKKISENINKLIEKQSKSKLNTMDTLLEIFNFGSDIVVNGMRNIGDLIKSDELVNDMTWLQDLYYSAKGPNSLGEQSSKMISQKYRDIHPSYLGKIDINVSSNSDVGMSGAFTPFVELFDRFYFTPEHEPCDAGYELSKIIAKHYQETDNANICTFDHEIDFKSKEDYLNFLNKYDCLFDGLKYEKIEIVEKEIDDTLPPPTIGEIEPQKIIIKGE